MSDLIDALPLLEKLDELIHEVWCIGHLTSDQIALRRSIRMHDEEITHRKIWPHTPALSPHFTIVRGRDLTLTCSYQHLRIQTKHQNASQNGRIVIPMHDPAPAQLGVPPLHGSCGCS